MKTVSMWRITMMVLATMAMGLLLLGCGGSSATAEEPSADQAAEQTEDEQMEGEAMAEGEPMEESAEEPAEGAEEPTEGMESAAE